MYADLDQPHPIKKCVVLCVTGLLCYIDPSFQLHHWNAHRNVIKHPGLLKLFRMLLDRFHVGLFATPISRDPVLILRIHCYS